MEDKNLTLTQHLSELRGAVIKSVICVLAVSCALCAYSSRILAEISRPVGGLVFIAPQEAFVTNLKVAFFGGLFLSSPFVIYQIWRFVSSGLNKKERRYVLIFGPFSFLFFLAGAAFGYFVIMPIGIKFLLGFATDFMSPMITVSKYISFVSGLVFAFAAVFQLPLVILFLTKVGLVTPAFLSRRRRHAIVIVFIAAAILTPPDAVTQCLMAIPLWVLYEVGIIISKIAYRPAI